MRDPLSLIVQAARLYHEQGRTQPEIAEQFGVSQSRVSRWLKEATERGIVRTVVLAPDGIYPELEEQIRERYSLRTVVVANTGPDESSLLTSLGSAAAIYLEATLARSARVGISSYSSSIMAAIDAMLPLKKRRAEQVVQIMGGIGRPDVQIMATNAADRLARLTGATPRFLPTPGLVGSRATRDALFEDPIVQEVAQEWRHLTDVIVGVGSVVPSTLLQSSGNSVSEADMEQLRALGAVGDVAMRFFDKDGTLIESELNARVIGIGADELRGIPRRIGIAGGARKIDAIHGALAGGWIDVLVTDFGTATRLLD